jgi:hypothetical protein
MPLLRGRLAEAIQRDAAHIDRMPLDCHAAKGRLAVTAQTGVNLRNNWIS